MGISRRLSGIVGILFCSISLISFCTITVSAATLHVPEDYITIQSAIDAAVDFDTVLINDGTYTGDGNRDIDYHGKAIVVKSVNGAASTIIDCQADSTNPHRGFIFHSGEDSLSILQGLTIQGGFAPGNLDSGQSNGGGILCDSSSSPTITECIITQNLALNSGGGIALLNGSPTLIRSEIVSNTAYNYSQNSIPAYGGGLIAKNCKGSVVDCDIKDNYASIGGGISCQNDSATFSSCRIHNNNAIFLAGIEPSAAGIGGGGHLFSSNAQFSYCEIFSNSAQTLSGFLADEGKGGGLAVIQSALHLKNCNIVYNIAEGWPSFFNGSGGGIFCVNSSTISFEECIVAFNKQAEGILISSSSTVTLECSDIFGNQFGDWIDPIDSQLNVNNNFSLDPQFCDSYSDDYQLSQTSPCLEGQSSCGERVGVNGMGCVTTGISDEPEVELPESFALHQNYPNPFNGTTTISFDSLIKSSFQFSIYNILGEVVHQVSGISVLGINTLIWNADKVASGIYFYSLKLGENNLTRKMLLLK